MARWRYASSPEVRFVANAVRQGLPSFKQALSDTYSPIFGRTIDPNLEISVTTGATEGLLSAIMAFVEPGEEVIVLEPVFNASAYNSSIFFKVSLLIQDVDTSTMLN